jgi:hypothetical protein
MTTAAALSAEIEDGQIQGMPEFEISWSRADGGGLRRIMPAPGVFLLDRARPVFFGKIKENGGRKASFKQENLSLYEGLFLPKAGAVCHPHSR